MIRYQQKKDDELKESKTKIEKRNKIVEKVLRMNKLFIEQKARKIKGYKRR